MRTVQCDGFVIFAPDDNRPAEPAKSRSARSSKSRARDSARQTSRIADMRPAAPRRTLAARVGIPVTSVVTVLIGLVVAYTFGRSAAVNGPESGFAYPRPTVASPARWPRAQRRPDSRLLRGGAP